MTETLNLIPGSIITCRDRQWVVLPAENLDVTRLRPLSGNEAQICGIYQPLEEEFALAHFPLPQSEAIQDHAAIQLIMDAARLSLRSGAGPFRCLGRIICPSPPLPTCTATNGTPTVYCKTFSCGRRRNW